MRRLAGLLVVVVAVLGAIEVFGPSVVERAVAARVKQESMLAASPEVELRGRPFLTQALRGTYDDIVVTSRDVPAGEISFEEVTTQLTAVKVPLASALTNQVVTVPVGRMSTRALVSYEALTAALADRRLTVTAADTGRLRVTSRVEVLGRELSAAAVSRPELVDQSIVVTAEQFEVGNDVADALITRALGTALDFTVPIDPLPYGLELRSVDARPDGVVVSAQAADVLLR